jgi:hypothetical protein
MRDFWDFIKMFTEDWVGRFLLALVALCIWFLITFAIACYQNELNHLDEGEVVDKCYTQEMYIWVSDGKSGHMQYYPPSYTLTITDGSKKYVRSVDVYEYHNYGIGEYYYSRRK